MGMVRFVFFNSQEMVCDKLSYDQSNTEMNANSPHLDRRHPKTKSLILQTIDKFSQLSHKFGGLILNGCKFASLVLISSSCFC